MLKVAENLGMRLSFTCALALWRYIQVFYVIMVNILVLANVRMHKLRGERIKNYLNQ